jgi:hypothetical protein
MSTDFKLSKRVHVRDLLDGRLARLGIYERINKETSAKQRYLTDGRNNFLWVYVDDEGFVQTLTRIHAEWRAR